MSRAGSAAMLVAMASAAFAADTADRWVEASQGEHAWSYLLTVGPKRDACGSLATPCREAVVEVRNDRRDYLLFCGASVKFQRPDSSSLSEAGWHDWTPVPPGAKAVVNLVRVPPDSQVIDVFTRCERDPPRPEPPAPPPPPRAAGCTTHFIKVADPNLFYPPAAKLEGREGAPVVSVSVRPGIPEPVTVTIVESSGQEDFDAAAIKLAKASTFTTNCPEGTLKFRMRFSLKHD